MLVPVNEEKEQHTIKAQYNFLYLFWQRPFVIIDLCWQNEYTLAPLLYQLPVMFVWSLVRSHFRRMEGFTFFMNGELKSMKLLEIAL